MLQWHVQIPVTELRRTVKAVVDALRSRISEGATAVGVSVLGNVQQAYQQKSRHGTGSDGVTWKPLQPETLEARVRRRGPSRKIVEQRAEIAAQIRSLLNAPNKAKTAKGMASEKARRETRIKALRRQRDELAKQHDGLVSAEIAEHQIGVDTGLQRASAAPGLIDPSGTWSQQPGDALGQNLFVVDGGETTIAYNREYSEFFDRERPLFPLSLPAEWRSDAEEIAHEWADEVVRETLERG